MSLHPREAEHQLGDHHDHEVPSNLNASRGAMACESRSVANQAGEWRVDENEFEVNGNGRPKATRVFSGSLTFRKVQKL